MDLISIGILVALGGGIIWGASKRRRKEQPPRRPIATLYGPKHTEQTNKLDLSPLSRKRKA